MYKDDKKVPVNILEKSTYSCICIRSNCYSGDMGLKVVIKNNTIYGMRSFYSRTKRDKRRNYTSAYYNTLNMMGSYMVYNHSSEASLGR